jgi:hypothetical protein
LNVSAAISIDPVPGVATYNTSAAIDAKRA